MPLISNPNILIITGEFSGETHATNLVKSFGESPPFSFSAMGGNLLASAGVTIIYDYHEISLMGFSEIFSKLFKIRKALKNVKNHIRHSRPSLIILIDFAGFNLRIAQFARSLNIPVIYFIPPQVWASRRYRIKVIKRCVNKVISILPFEKGFYDNLDIDVTYIGHPFQKTVVPSLSRDLFFTKTGINTNNPLITIMPGSRHNEINKHMPVLLDVIDIIKNKIPHIQMVLPLADNLHESVLARFKKKMDDIKVIRGQAHNALAYCDIAIVASGSVTLEAAILKTPTIVVYRLSSLSYALARILVKIQWISLPNIIAGKEVFPEFVQKLDPEQIAERAISMVHNGRESFRIDADEIAAKLGTYDSYPLARDEIIAFIEKRYDAIPKTP